MARLGYFLWTIGSLNASTICSLVAKVTNDLPALGTSPCRWRKSAGCGRKLKMSGCEKRQNNQNLKLGVREESKAAIIPHNPDTSSRTPFNPKDKCGLNAPGYESSTTNPLWKPISYLWEIISMVTQSRSCSIRVNTRFPPFSATCVIDS